MSADSVPETTLGSAPSPSLHSGQTVQPTWEDSVPCECEEIFHSGKSSKDGKMLPNLFQDKSLTISCLDLPYFHPNSPIWLFKYRKSLARPWSFCMFTQRRIRVTGPSGEIPGCPALHLLLSGNDAKSGGLLEFFLFFSTFSMEREGPIWIPSRAFQAVLVLTVRLRGALVQQNSMIFAGIAILHPSSS